MPPRCDGHRTRALVVPSRALPRARALEHRPESATPDGGPRFSITIPPGRSEPSIDGRLLLLLSTDPAAEPRMQINDSPRTQMVFGMDVDAMTPGQPVTLDAGAFGFPIRSLHDVPAGRLLRAGRAASVRDVPPRRRPDTQAPDGSRRRTALEPGARQPVLDTARRSSLGTAGDRGDRRWTRRSRRSLTRRTRKYIRHLKIQSALLTKFWGRPMYLSANVLVPEGFDTHTQTPGIR